MNKKQSAWLTEEASQALEHWLRRHEGRWAAEGADPEEVRDDILAHIAVTCEQNWTEGTRVGVKRLEQFLEDLEMPPLGTVPDAQSYEEFGFWASLRDLLAAWFTNRYLLAFWPLTVVLVASFTEVLPNFLMDPVTRASQIWLLSGVTGINAVLQLEWSRHWPGSLRAFLLGVGLPTTAYWLIFGMVVAVAGTLGYGALVVYTLGIALLAAFIWWICLMVAVSPLICAMGLWRQSAGDRSWVMTGAGALCGFMLLLMVEGPAYAVRLGVTSGNLDLARQWGSEEVLLDLCYEGSRGRFASLDTSGFVMRHLGYRRGPSREEFRTLYYQVTGRSYNSVRPDSRFSKIQRAGGYEVSFDQERGGDEVAAVIKDLDLVVSRLDGHLDGASRLGYWEWTMEFENESWDQQEARFQMLLPPGGVVSRLTLWVNGEPEEAAFAAKQKVTQAYKTIVARRQDPVLVRWVAPDRALVQCFPVPVNGRMKIRVGMTAPLDDEGQLFLPRIIERNFAFASQLDSTVWVQGDLGFSLDAKKSTAVSGGRHELQMKFAMARATSEHLAVSSASLPDEVAVWTRDPFAPEGEEIVMAQRRTRERKEKRRVTLVVDGSEYFADWAEAFQKAVTRLREKGHEVSVIYAAEDGVVHEGSPAFVGGQNSVIALLEALDERTEDLVWLHGEPAGRISRD